MTAKNDGGHAFIIIVGTVGLLPFLLGATGGRSPVLWHVLFSNYHWLARANTTDVDPNTLNLDPDPGFWPNLDPDSDPAPDPGLCFQF